MKTEQRLKQLGINLPAVSSPVATYVNAVRSGNLMFLSGKGPGYGADRVRGKVGADMSPEEAKTHARSTGLNLIAVMKDELGDLDRVKRVVKVLGMVNCTPDFAGQPGVINGCSDLFVEVFGERGRHARSAVGMVALPNGIPVEIECVIEVADAAPARAARPAAKKVAKKKAAKKKR
ncbi:MAG TPA: RidA family protein [Vineibacter sp.]|nr:RidA family protein [Vineibacter sp.]